jgi:DNA replication protein DnaC
MRQLTLDRLDELSLEGMKRALKQQIANPASSDLSFEERFELLLDAECELRTQRRLATRVKRAGVRQNARIEELDYKAMRKLDRSLLDSLASCRWLKEKRNVILVGPTGIGKTFLSSALTLKACEEGFASRYFRAPRLLHELEVGRADGTHKHKLASRARVDLVVLDDWLVAPPSDGNRRDLLEILDDRYGRKSTMICSQLPVEHWHQAFGDPTLADAILDRLVHNAYRLEIQGESLRKTRGLDMEQAGIIDKTTKA